MNISFQFVADHYAAARQHTQDATGLEKNPRLRFLPWQVSGDENNVEISGDIQPSYLLPLGVRAPIGYQPQEVLLPELQQHRLGLRGQGEVPVSQVQPPCVYFIRDARVLVPECFRPEGSAPGVQVIRLVVGTISEHLQVGAAYLRRDFMRDVVLRRQLIGKLLESKNFNSSELIV